MKIESYDIRMDSVGARSSGSTRKFSVGHTAGHDKPESDRYSKSFSDTLFSMERGDGDERSLTSGKDLSKDDDPFAGLRTSNVRFLKNADISSDTPVVRDIQSVRQQFVLYLWRLFFGDESARELSKKYGINDRIG